MGPRGPTRERIPPTNSRIELLNQSVPETSAPSPPLKEERVGERRHQGSGGILNRRSKFDVRRSMFPKFMGKIIVGRQDRFALKQSF
jgi:hypothetical protein